MDKDLQDIEDLFREGLEDNEDMPSPKVWSGIDNILDKNTLASIKKKYTALKRVALLLLFLLLIISIYELSNRQSKNEVAKQLKENVNKDAISNDNINEASGNTTPSQKPVNSPDLHENDNKNIATDNTTKVKPDNNFLPEKKNRNTILNKQIGIVKNSTNSKHKQPLNSKDVYKLKIKSGKPVKDNELAIITNGDTETNSRLPVLKQLNPVTTERINIPISNSLGAKKLLQPLTVNKIISPANTKNVVAPTNKKIKERKPSRFSVALFFSPDAASYNLLADKPDNQPDNTIKIKKSERHEFSSTSGALIDYKINKHFALVSGLTFSNTNITVEPKTIYAKADNSGNIKYRLNISSGYGYLVPSFQPSPSVGDTLNVTAITHKLRYIGIPIAVKYSILKGKLKIEAIAGVSANFLTMGKIETEIQRGSNNEIDILNNIKGLKSIYFTGIAGIGAEYKLTDKFSFTLMPTARFALNPINKGAVVKTYSNSLGIAGGIRFQF